MVTFRNVKGPQGRRMYKGNVWKGGTVEDPTGNIGTQAGRIRGDLNQSTTSTTSTSSTSSSTTSSSTTSTSSTTVTTS